jgi:hypothetical protein
MTVQGTITAVNTATGEWRIGTPPVFVYESAATTIEGTPVVGEEVRVTASRTQAAGPLVAGVITELGIGALPAPPAIKDTAFLFNGIVQTVQPAAQVPGLKTGGAAWTIGGLLFRIDASNTPASIGVGLGLNSPVTVKFNTPPTAGASTNTALEIFAESATAAAIPPVLHPAPVLNTALSPLSLPAGAFRLFVVTGVVTGISPGGEWVIGNGAPPVNVYEHAATTLSTPRPIIGDEVTVVAVRSLAPGPLVARSITFRRAGPLPAAPASVATAFLLNGTVQTITAATWTVGGVGFAVNDPAEPAVIASGVAVGSSVTVEFAFNGPPAPDPAIWAPLNAGTGAAWSSSIALPAVTANRNGFLFLRATDSLQRVSTVMIPASLLTAIPPPPPPPAGGGGGGFGGGGGGGASGQLNAIGFLGTMPAMDATGKILGIGQLKTGDGKLSLDIPINTVIRNAAGAAAFSISAAAIDAPPPGPTGGAVIMAYEMEPIGVTFTPAVTLAMSYADAQIPAGMPESSFYLASWDGAKWVKLASIVDAANNKVTAQVDHFSIFALLGQQPPATTTPPTTPPTTTPPTTTPPPTTAATTSPPPTTTVQPTTPLTTTAPSPRATNEGFGQGLIIGFIAAALVVGLFVLNRNRNRKSG